MAIFKRNKSKRNEKKEQKVLNERKITQMEDRVASGDHCKDENSISSVQCWHYDRYESQLVQANRWLFAFCWQIGVTVLLGISLVVLLPLKTLVPLVIRQNSQTHEVFVDKIDKQYVPHQNEIESDLVRYLILRETYSCVDLASRYRQVLLETSKASAIEYQKTQANNNPDSPVNLYGVEGTRTIQVEDVVFLSNKMSSDQKETGNNLAKVDFVSVETLHQQSVKKHWVATLSWEYTGTPQDKEAAWQNWNGFTVTYYRIDQRNIGETR